MARHRVPQSAHSCWPDNVASRSPSLLFEAPKQRHYVSQKRICENSTQHLLISNISYFAKKTRAATHPSWASDTCHAAVSQSAIIFLITATRRLLSHHPTFFSCKWLLVFSLTPCLSRSLKGTRALRHPPPRILFWEHKNVPERGNKASNTSSKTTREFREVLGAPLRHPNVCPKKRCIQL